MYETKWITLTMWYALFVFEGWIREYMAIINGILASWHELEKLYPDKKYAKSLRQEGHSWF